MNGAALPVDQREFLDSTIERVRDNLGSDVNIEAALTSLRERVVIEISHGSERLIVTDVIVDAERETGLGFRNTARDLVGPFGVFSGITTTMPPRVRRLRKSCILWAVFATASRINPFDSRQNYRIDS